MASLVIVSGCPGSGKTTVAASLARTLPSGLHLESDTFYAFPARLVEPTRPESHRQNETIMRALARATGAFLEGGYSVVLEGIVGPWFLPTLRAELPAALEIAYVVLRIPPDAALRRVRERQGAGASARVRATCDAFADLGPHESHVVDTLDRTPDAVLAELRDGLDAGRFLLPQ